MKNKINKKLLFAAAFLSASTFVFIIPVVVQAFLADPKTYTPLMPIEGLTPAGNEPVNLTKYLNNLYVFTVSIAVVIAVLMITVGGFSYIVGASSGDKSEGKEKIKNAIFGLVLMLLSYLIVNTINKDALNFDFFRTAPAGVDEFAKVDLNGIGLNTGDPAVNYGGGFDQTQKGKWGLFVVTTSSAASKDFYFDSKELCEQRKSELSGQTTLKYQLPPTRECKESNFESGDSAYIYTYKYYTYPRMSGFNVYGPYSEKTTEETDGGLTMQECEDRRGVIVRKSTRRKPYQIASGCKPQTASFGMSTGESFKINYPYNEQKDAGTFTSVSYTPEMCAQKVKEIVNIQEEYVSITECKPGELTGGAAKKQATEKKKYCQSGVFEIAVDVSDHTYNTNCAAGTDCLGQNVQAVIDLFGRDFSNGKKPADECFSTLKQCQDSYTQKQNQKVPKFSLSSCIEIK